MRYIALAASLTLAVGVTPALAQQTAYAIGNGGASLIRFDTSDPMNATFVADFNGDALSLDSIDFRPATGELFGYLDSDNAYYTVNLSTGQLTQVSASPVGATTNSPLLSMDFNPTIDRLRVVTDSGQNIVYNPEDGTAASVIDLFYVGGDVNEGANASIIANAYTQNFAGATSTTQYAIDYNLNILAILGNNTGELTTVGPLGVDTDIFTGMDIFTDSFGTDIAYAILTGPDSISGFYTIDLATGAASLVGNLGVTTQVSSLAVIPAPASLALFGVALIPIARRRRSPATVA